MVKKHCKDCKWMHDDRIVCVMSGCEVLPDECSCFWFEERKRGDADAGKGLPEADQTD